MALPPPRRIWSVSDAAPFWTWRETALVGFFLAALAFYLWRIFGAPPPEPPTGDGAAADAAEASVDVWFPVTPDARWNTIIVHHTATVAGSPAALDRYHRETRKMANGLAYHFVIGNGRSSFGDGEVFVSDRWREQRDGGHVRDPALNRVAVGVCLVGIFEETDPTPAQRESLARLLAALMARCGIAPADVIGHRNAPGAKTLCPGRRLPLADIVREAEKLSDPKD